MKIQNRQQLLGLAAAAVVGLFAADKLLFSHLTGFWKARAKELGRLREQVTEGRGLIAREQSLRSRWDTMRTNTLPTDQSQAEQQVFKAFDRWAQDSRISINSITPQWKHDSPDFITLQCRVDASGNLETIKRFLFDIEKDPLALKLESVEITTKDAEGQLLTLGLQISGLVLAPTEKTEKRL